MAKSKAFTIDDAQAEVVSAFEKFIATLAAQGGAGKVSGKSSKAAEEVEDDEDEEGSDEDLTREMVEEATAEGIVALRALAKEWLEDPPKSKADILAAFDEVLPEEDEEDEEDEDEDEDAEDEEDEDGEEEFDRDELEELDLKELRKTAKEAGHDASEYKGMDKDALIDLIMGEEDEDEDEEDEEEDEDEDVEELDEDALAAMSHKELLALAKELEIKVPKTHQKASKSNQKKLVELILDSGEDEE